MNTTSGGKTTKQRVGKKNSLQCPVCGVIGHTNPKIAIEHQGSAEPTKSPPFNREKRISTEDLLFIVATRVVKALTGSTVNQATYRGHFEHKKTGKKYTYTFKMKI